MLWYAAYPISYLELEEMMKEQGVAVDHECRPHSRMPGLFTRPDTTCCHATQVRGIERIKFALALCVLLLAQTYCASVEAAGNVAQLGGGTPMSPALKAPCWLLYVPWNER